MWIKEIEIKNVGRHRYLHLHLQRGLVGIFGPNGSGKSTVTDGVYAATTNNWSRFPGVKTDNINATAPEDEESFIRYVAEHNDVTFELFRQLRRVKGSRGGRKANELIIGKETFDKDEDINRELSSRLGVNSDLIGTYVFVSQLNIFDFLAQTAGERAKTYQTLCGTLKAATIEDAVDTMLTGDSVLTAEVIDNSDELLQRVGQLEQSILAAQSERDAAAANMLDETKLTKARSIKAKRDNWDQLSKDKPAIVEKLTNKETEANAIIITLAAALARLHAAESAFRVSKPKAETAQRTLDAQKQATAAINQRNKLQKRLIEAQEALSRIKTGVRHPEAVIRAEHARAKADKEATLRANKKILDNFAKDGIAACPTCGTKVKNLHAHLQLLRSQNESLEAEIDQYDGLISLIDEIDDRLNTAATERKRLTDLIPTIESQIATLNVVTPPDTDPAVLQKEVDAHGENGDELEAAREAHSDLRDNLMELQSWILANQEQLSELEAKLAANVVTDELLAKVNVALAKHDRAAGMVNVVDERLDVLNNELKQRRDESNRVKAVLDRNRKARAFAKKAAEIREIMHRQALPAYVATSNLQDMEADINLALDDFGSPFWVEATDNLSFTVHFPGEPARAAERLSVGQKAVLAVCFRSAVAGLFDKDLDLLCLDEPTAGMDEANVAFLAQSLERYADRVRGRRQVIMITHASALRSAFDQVIELGRTA